MQRLIDANVLMPNAEYKGKYDTVNAYDIVNCPTVDAIPIEWINEFSNDYCDWSQEQLIGVLLRVWNKKRVPTVDAEPVKHGYWEWTDDPRTGDFVCSNCLDHNIVRSRYCPNCGAKMDGERKEDADTN